ncbi:MAG: hypothetical protein Q8N88_06015 [Nanoarchaeota archaeon]|nr:hypothetical protein [Nanoarchaeota archaeon]
MEITQEQINTRQQELERSGYRLISEKVIAIRVGKTLDEFLDGNRQSEFAVIPNNPRAIFYRFYIRDMPVCQQSSEQRISRADAMNTL